MSDYRGASTDHLTPPSAWIDDISKWLGTNWELFDPSHAHRTFWPDQPYRPDMEILVAGCGPVQAAVIAYTNPQARVTAIDTDDAALNHETFLRHKHLLLNLDARTLRPLPLEHVSALGKSFDLIIASGVLNELTSPAAGISALAEALRPDGVLAIMLPSQQSVDPGQNHESTKSRTFSVQDCLELVEGAGLIFQDWFLKSPYYPAGLAAVDHEAVAALLALPDRDMWSAIEPLRNQTGRHLFMACRPDRPVQSYRINFASHDAADYVPHGGLGTKLSGQRLIRPGYSILLDSTQLTIAKAADGDRSIHQIADFVGEPSGRAIAFFKQLWWMDFISISLPYRWN